MRIAVVIPAHNEIASIGTCLAAVRGAAGRAISDGHRVSVHVVCDDCTDGTGRAVRDAGFEALSIAARNVGRARARGARVALAAGAEWLAFTDADTEVSPGWLVEQVGLGADAVCGTVQVTDWQSYGVALQQHFARTYFDVDGHRHVHGANLGMSAAAYRGCGGFASLENSEDADIVASLERAGFTIAWSNRPRVTTSARADYRATAGFGAALAAAAAAAVAVATTPEPHRDGSSAGFGACTPVT